MPKYLGIDYGLKRVGIAVSDSGRSISFAREHITNDDRLLNKIEDLVRQEDVVKIIIGLPVSMSGQSNEQTAATLKFTETLSAFLTQKSLAVQIDHIDERLTSRIAESEVIASVTRRSKRREKGRVDELSARIILQDYMDRERNLNK